MTRLSGIAVRLDFTVRDRFDNVHNIFIKTSHLNFIIIMVF